MKSRKQVCTRIVGAEIHPSEKGRLPWTP